MASPSFEQGCRFKRAYTSRQRALRAARTNGHHVGAYRCQHCGMHHTTSEGYAHGAPDGPLRDRIVRIPA
jgi:hypothetical protein